MTTALQSGTARRSIVWIVEDSPLEAEVESQTLASEFEVRVFPDGHAALEALNSSELPEVIVLDSVLPDISGIEVCQFVRSTPATRALPILILSTRQERQDIVDGLAAGANDYVTKPFDGPELVARVNALVRGRRQVERAERAEAALRELLEHLPDPVVTFGHDDRITFVNIEGLRVLGRTREELLAKPIGHVLAGVSVASTSAGSEHGDLADIAIGPRLFAPAIRSLPISGVPTTMLTLRDVTADRTLALDLRAADRRKDEFIATVSHELRTPLAAIMLWSELLENPELEREQIERAVNAIQTSARTQHRLIEDLLDVSRMLAGDIRLNVEEIDVTAVLHAAVEIVGPMATTKGIEIVETIGGRANGLTADAGRIQQVIVNLLNNAVKFTPPGGWVHVRQQRKGEVLSIQVSDNGQGIEPEFLPDVFDRFRQADSSTSRRHGGLGLGLAIARELVELHGGTIRAESPGRGRGATFTIELPVTGEIDGAMVGAHPGGARAARRYVPSPVLRGVRVLVVEDDPATQVVIQYLLMQSEAEVTAVDSAANALLEFETPGPGQRFDVLVCDIGLPGMDGHELMREIRAIERRTGAVVPIRAIALTAFAHEQDRADATAAGFDQHLGKPVEAATLVNGIAGLPRASRRGN